jgi:DNA-binding NarL/FixJ family response regulator
VHRAIGTLPERQQEVVNLWSEGFAYREISQITGATENYVRVMVHRAFQTLREHPLLRRLIAEETGHREVEGHSEQGTENSSVGTAHGVAK